MEVHVTPEAQEYIAQNGGSAIVIKGRMQGCCGGTVSLPKIELGKPENEEKYHLTKWGQATLYIDEELRNMGRIAVSFAKVLWVKKLSVDLE